MHFDAFYTVALARLTSAALDVERKAPCAISSCLSVRSLCEKVSYIGEKSRIGCRVGTWGTSDGTLVYANDLIECFVAEYIVVVARNLIKCTVELGCELRIEYSVDKRGFARAGDAADDGERTEGDLYVDILKVMLSCTTYFKEAAVTASSRFRSWYFPSPCEICARDGRRAIHYLLGCACDDDLAAVNACTGTYINDIIGFEHGFLVVLDDYDRISDITQIFKRGYEL